MGTPYFQLKHRDASGEPATTAEALAESLAAYTAQAAAKLRRHGLLAAWCNIYAQVFASCGGISPERSEHCEAMSLEGYDFLGRTVVFPAPTDATNEMLRAIREEVDALYVPGTRYRKTGIVFFGLEKPGTAHQTDLFDDTPPAEKSRLYAAVAVPVRPGDGLGHGREGRVYFAVVFVPPVVPDGRLVPFAFPEPDKPRPRSDLASVREHPLVVGGLVKPLCCLLREGLAVVPLLQPVGYGGSQDAAQGALGHVGDNVRIAPLQGTGIERIERFDFRFQGLWQFFHR